MTYKQVDRIPHAFPACSNTTCDCMANSLVGARTSIMGDLDTPSGLLVFFLWIMCARAGTEKASVLPEPVSAIPTMSRPEATMGQHRLWIGVGLAKFLQAVRQRGSKLVSLNSRIGRKFLLPGEK